jgi:hypothetical protein
VYALAPVFVKVKSSGATTTPALLLDVPPRKFPSPEYVAVITAVAPAGSNVVSCATPAVTGSLINAVPLSKNVTVPLGIVGVPAIVAATVAISVTVCTGLAVAGLALTLVTVGC